MSDLSDRLKTTLVARLPGAGSEAVDLEINNATHEWFLESGTWHEIVYANLRHGKDEYYLTPSAGTVGFICDITIDGQAMRPLSANANPTRRWGSGMFQCLTDFGTITSIHPVPTEDKPKGIVANVSVIPSLDSSEAFFYVPDDLLNHWYEAILDTALSKLYSHVNRPYTNPQMALYHVGRYRAHLTRARRIVAGGNVRAGGPWAFPQIAPGRGRRGPALPRGV